MAVPWNKTSKPCSEKNIYYKAWNVIKMFKWNCMTLKDWPLNWKATMYSTEIKQSLYYCCFILFVLVLSIDRYRKPCTNAVSWSFLPRSATQAPPMPSCGVCLSVRPSVTFVDSVKTSNLIFKLFSPSGSQTILVFPYQTAWQYSDRGRRMQME